MRQKYIEIKGARVHNLKNINIRIPRNKLVVISGLSGSGKSTLAFDTLFAEGQRRYVESLSSYARQFLGRINKPETDSITGIPPAIAIEQKVNIRNPRSTVGTSTEIYDYMKLLYTKIGRTYSPVSGEEVRIDSITDIVNYFASRPPGEKIMILAPMVKSKTLGFVEQLTLFIEEGFSRVVILSNTTLEMIDIKKYLTYYDAMYSKKRENTYLLIDRIAVSDEAEYLTRVADSAQTAFDKSAGQCCLYVYPAEEEPFIKRFSSAFETDDLRFEKPDENLFSFNSPTGACPQCKGYGKVEGIDEDSVIPDKSLSIYENAIACWRGESMSAFRDQLIYAAPKFNFPIHRPYYQLNQQERELLWTGNRWFDGLTAFFNMLEANRYKIQYRVMLSRYKGKTLCPSCHGSRLCREAAYIRVGDKNITELVTMPITTLKEFFQNLTLTEYETQIARRTLSEITGRIQCLIDLGLGYLTLDRLSNTLSGGESQRVNLSVSLGSSLVGSLYILDEPSVGLHPRDSARMVKVLKDLRDLGNTVVVVEHEEEIMHAADEIIDIGPLSGRFGGEIVFQGKLASATDADKQKSLTLKYLSGTEKIEVPAVRRR
ncbi:MAG: excinuclease ABC subunit A, partial [Prevotellaceae bacterium]|nr:excinuclease ABC subunit A [Prevotellaceae bacterium]